MKRTLVIAPGRKTRGGITAVVKAYETTVVWKQWNCFWIETQIDRNNFLKLWYFIRAFILYLFLLPTAGIVHIHLSEPMSAFRKSFFFWPARWLKKPVIVHFHSFSPDTTIKGKYKSLYRKIFKKSNLVLVLSSFWEDEVKKAFGTDTPVSVLYNPCPLLENPNDVSERTSPFPYVLYAGTVTKRKGYSDLIKAFAVVTKDYPEWKLIIAGNGEIEKANMLTQQLQIENKVEFKGWVSGNDKDKIFREATIFCLPSYAEGFPMAVLDAIAYKLPVITTPVGGIMDVFVNGENALIFQPGDISGLKTALTKLIANPDLRKSIASKSYTLSVKQFDLNLLSEILSHHYKKITQSQV